MEWGRYSMGIFNYSAFESEKNKQLVTLLKAFSWKITEQHIMVIGQDRFVHERYERGTRGVFKLVVDR